MQSDKRTINQERSFIEDARRVQIINSAIAVLAEVGYLNASFVRIGQHAGISPSLISYHFKDKNELTQEIMRVIFEERVAHVRSQVAKATTATDKIHAAIIADIDEMSARPERFAAAAEIIFSLRSDSGAMAFLGSQETPLFILIRTILEEGQRSGEFGNIDAYNLALIIDGARDSFLAQLPMKPNSDKDAFTKTLLDTIMCAVRKLPHVKD